MKTISGMTAVCMVLAVQSATAKDFWADFPHVTHSTYIEPNGDRAIRLSIEVPATPQQCFDAFATTEGFRSWAVPGAHIDLQNGGLIESSYEPTAKIGDPNNIKNQIVAFIPAELLVIKNVQAPASFVDADLFQHTVTIISLRPLDAGHTQVTLVNSGYGISENFDKLMKKFEWGDAYTLEQLKTRFEKGPTDWSSPGKQTESSESGQAGSSVNQVFPVATVHSVQIGRVAPLGPEGVPSAFVKRPIDGPIVVATLGLAGDEQADLRVHGGPDKAVYGYAHSNYPAWLEAYPQHSALLVPGGFGENLTLDDLR